MPQYSSPADIDSPEILYDIENSTRREKWRKAANRIKDFRCLDNGWDGEDAISPSRQLLDSIEALFSQLQSKSSIAPDFVSISEDSAISIIWNDLIETQIMEIDRPFEGVIWRKSSGELPIIENIRWKKMESGFYLTQDVDSVVGDTFSCESMMPSGFAYAV